VAGKGIFGVEDRKEAIVRLKGDADINLGKMEE
jgi:hypothetical protein